MGDDLRNRCLAGPRRSVEDDRPQLVRLNRTVEQLILSQNMLLSHDLFQPHRTHPGGERGFGFHGAGSHIIE